MIADGGEGGKRLGHVGDVGPVGRPGCGQPGQVLHEATVLDCGLVGGVTFVGLTLYSRHARRGADRSRPIAGQAPLPTTVPPDAAAGHALAVTHQRGDSEVSVPRLSAPGRVHSE